MAMERFIPLLTIDYRSRPRAALAYSFISLVAIMHNLGLISDKTKDIAETYRVLEGLRARFDVPIPLRRNPAKELATRLFGRLAIIYGAGFLSDVARRWKTQINENSKAWAFYEVFPELSHNSVVGYEFPLEVGRRAFVVLLRSPKLHPQILKRYEATSELLAQRGIEHLIVDAEGESILCQMMSLIFLGDYVSYYLALLYKVDPTPVKAIDFLKERLAGD
jgi:glucose/mannose-6-phosphate isomerase